MSEENVAFVRGLFEGAANLDKETVLALLPELVPQTFTADAVWIEDPQRADQQIWRGHDGICSSWRQWLDNWDDWEFEVIDVEDHGDQVFVIARERGAGAVSGAAVEESTYAVLTFRDGKIARYEEFHEERQGRAALD
jgi:ketosteroid isomerase-like protein